MRKICTLLMIGTLFFEAAKAQKISGTITDAATKEALIGVNIVLTNGGGTSTDIDGKYLLQIAEGEQKITFKYIGYEDIVKTITVQKHQQNLPN